MRILQARHDNQPQSDIPDTDWLDNHPKIFYPVLGGVLGLVTVVSLWLLWRGDRSKCPCFSREKPKKGNTAEELTAATAGAQVGAKAGRVYLADLKYAKAAKEEAELSSPVSAPIPAPNSPSTPSSKSRRKKLLKKSRKEVQALPRSPLASQPPITHARSASAPVASTTGDALAAATTPDAGAARSKTAFASPASSFQFPSPLPPGPMPHYSLDSLSTTTTHHSHASQEASASHTRPFQPPRSYSNSFASTSASATGSWTPSGPNGWSIHSAPSSRSTPTMSGSVAYSLTQAQAYTPPHPPEQAYHPPGPAPAPTMSIYSQSSAAPSSYVTQARPTLSIVQPAPTTAIAEPVLHMPIPRPPRGASLGVRSRSSHAL